jgi:hypothetical protein
MHDSVSTAAGQIKPHPYMITVHSISLSYEKLDCMGISTARVALDLRGTVVFCICGECYRTRRGEQRVVLLFLPIVTVRLDSDALVELTNTLPNLQVPL